MTHKRLRKLMLLPFELLATVLYMLGFIGDKDLYWFIYSINPGLARKLVEEGKL